MDFSTREFVIFQISNQFAKKTLLGFFSWDAYFPSKIKHSDATSAKGMLRERCKFFTQRRKTDFATSW